MKKVNLLNLRELSSEEQLALNGGTALCDIDGCGCSCPCKCNKDNPSRTVGNEFSETGMNATYARKEREAMSK